MKVIITIEVDGENINVSTDTKGSEKGDLWIEPANEYSRVFDETCTGWTNDPKYNLMFITCQQNYANCLLRDKGHLFLNEVFDMFGIPRTKIGQIVGWVYEAENPIGDNFVDFGIQEEFNVDFLNGNINTAILNFNVDGNILDRI